MAKCKHNFDKDELERLYKEHGSFRLAGVALGVSKTTFMQQYRKSQGQCVKCANKIPDGHPSYNCQRCLEDNRVEDRPSSKKCEYCEENIYRLEEQSKLSWSKKKGCDDCLDKLYGESLKRTKHRYRARYNAAIRNNPKTKEYQVRYRKSEVGQAKRRASASTRRAAKVATASPTIYKYLEDLVLNKHLHNCPYCPSTDNLSIDHIVPLSRGGTHTEDNVELVCLECNIRKGNKTKEEFIQFLQEIKE